MVLEAKRTKVELLLIKKVLQIFLRVCGDILV